MKTLIISQLPLLPDEDEAAVIVRAKKRISRLGVNATDCEGYIYRRSVDARKQNDVKFVCSVALSGDFPTDNAQIMKRLADNGVTELRSGEPSVVHGDGEMQGRAVIVGTGPAGLFAGLLLAENGYSPILIERGGDVDARVRAIEKFKSERILDTDTNIQFGAGGAGTFSDGKLVTRVNDPLCGYILRRFVEFGAPKEILYTARPHIGTDYLRLVVKNMTEHIISLGAEIRYNTKLLDISVSGNRAISVRTTGGDIEAGAVVLAIGHSARDTYKMLLSKSFVIEPKPFSVGVRVEHLREDINRAMYGNFAEHPAFSSAEYNLSCNTKIRGAYTFCMCPGGSVVAAASEEGGVVVNGMSTHARNSDNSNSAVAVSVFREDYGNTPDGAIEFQRKIERRAFRAGGGDYSAPIITLGDFLGGERATHLPKRVMPTYMDGEGVRLASPEEYLPDFVTKNLRSAFLEFDKKIKGFAVPDAVLTGAETRTSAPVRIMRGEDRCALGYDNIYPCGEGAGYAGGITSAALDGINTALSIMAKFKP
ncbi:MAG: hypothetical protein IKA74_06830 [Clostridia bacterium]|nr:hypothetical protein [Clostridia bacterium]